MRTALQRLLSSPSALSLLQYIVQFDGHCICQSSSVTARRRELTWRPIKSHGLGRIWSRKISGVASSKEHEVQEDPSPETRRVDFQEPKKLRREDETGRNPEDQTRTEKQNRSCHIQHHVHDSSSRIQMLTFDEVQYQSNLEGRLIDNRGYNTEWTLWLELIRFRIRHDGLQGVRPIYTNMFKRKLQLPTYKDGADELWDLLLQSGFEDALWMEEIISYAVQLKRGTGKAWVKLYGSILGYAFQADRESVLRLHDRLKDNFPPSIEDYRYLFDNSLSGNSVSKLMILYRDLPIVGMYAKIVPELCKLQRYKEARKWHHLLCVHKDLPQDIKDIKPLLVYYVQSGDDRQVERITQRLDDNQDGQSLVPSLIHKYLTDKEVISRELMNRQLGEVHGVTPKHLSDGFCARLFATKLIGVDTIISGLQMMGVQVIGPLSLREMAARDACDHVTVCRRLDRLQDAGIEPDDSVFSTILVKLAHKHEAHKLLKSVVECDLHPDTFEDFELQERLLSEYYERNDTVQIERTLAIITSRCTKESHRDVWRWNLTLRAYVTLRRADEIYNTLGKMQQKHIVLSARSSQYIRRELLSERRAGHAAQTTHELSILIKASQMSMQSGYDVPIIAWREIMRRLGMAGRLLEFENLAFWLTDYYLGITATQSSKGPKSQPLKNKIPRAAAAELSRNSNVNSHLKVLLYHYAAQQAIITWGFLHKVRSGPPSSKRHRRLRREAAYRPGWRWGLRLLKNLQERGVPIQKDSIARICRIRLLALFGNGVSNRPINREAKWLNDERARKKKGRRYRMEYYIKEMEAIWGEDLFRHQDQHFGDRINRSERGTILPAKESRRWTRDNSRRRRNAHDLQFDDTPQFPKEIEMEPYCEELGDHIS